MEVITGLTIGDGSVTPQNINILTGAQTYLTLPDGVVVPITAGIVSDTNWAGSAGNLKFCTIKGVNQINFTSCDFGGNIVTSSIGGVISINDPANPSLTTKINKAYFNSTSSITINTRGLLYLEAAKATTVTAYSNTLMESFYAPKATNLRVENCALTANSIGDFLIAASVNNPTAVGASANFSGGTNANRAAINAYLITKSTTLAAIELIIDPTWTLTFNA